MRERHERAYEAGSEWRECVDSAEAASGGISVTGLAASQEGLVQGLHLEDEGGPLLYLQRAQPSLS